MFESSELAAAVGRTLASPKIPAGANGVVLAVANEQGVGAIVAVRIADGWQVSGGVNYVQGTHALGFGVHVAGTF